MRVLSLKVLSLKRGNILNIVLVIVALAFLVVCALSVRIRPAADSVAVLETAGLTCGGGSGAIERALLARGGVAGVEVDAAKGRIIVGFDSKRIKPEALAATVAGAGYGSSVERLLTPDQYRVMTGRLPGRGSGKKADCSCGNR